MKIKSNQLLQTEKAGLFVLEVFNTEVSLAVNTSPLLRASCCWKKDQKTNNQYFSLFVILACAWKQKQKANKTCDLITLSGKILFAAFSTCKCTYVRLDANSFHILHYSYEPSSALAVTAWLQFFGCTVLTCPFCSAHENIEHQKQQIGIVCCKMVAVFKYSKTASKQR